MRLTREFYRPAASLNAEKQVIADIPGSEIYRFQNSMDKPTAVVFGGRRAKPDFRFYFQDEAARENRIRMWAESQRERAARIKAARKERNAPHGFEVGQKFYISWGYDQTNINFYKLVELKGKCMGKIVPVCGRLVSSNPPCDKVVCGDEIREWDVLLNVDESDTDKGVWKKLSTNGFSCDSRYFASPDNGQEHYETSAGWGH